MASNYTGTPTAVQSPSAAPNLTAYPIGSLPADGDGLNVASILQDFRVALDFIAYLQDRARDTIFGTGADGAYTASTFLSLSGIQYYSTFTANISSSIYTNGWPIIARNSITIGANMNVVGNGGNASGTSAGTYQSGVCGPHGNVCPTSAMTFMPASGVSGVNLFQSQTICGLGGAGGKGGGTNTLQTSIVSPGSSYKSFPYRLAQSIQGIGTVYTQANTGVVQYLSNTQTFDSIRGGGAGAPGDPASAGAGGGAGAGGALIVMMAPTITINGTWQSNGGAGGAGGATNGNGGGGGGGGAFLFVCQTFVNNGATFSASGGVGGFGQGSGAGGTTGGAGNTTPYVVLVP